MFKGSWRALLAGLTSSAGERDPLGSALGHLERQVMDVVWQNERVSVRDVRAQLARTVAYTTVMTTLDRLFKKGLLLRVREGRAFVYCAAFTRQDVESAVASGLLRRLLEGGAGGVGPVLSNLVDVIGDRDGALLDELEELVRKKRRQNPA
jgi:predicted transcriptional regulator